MRGASSEGRDQKRRVAFGDQASGDLRVFDLPSSIISLRQADAARSTRVRPKAEAREAVALLSNRERRDSMARAARNAWERRFTKEKFQERILGIMSECGIASARPAEENSRY